MRGKRRRRRRISTAAKTNRKKRTSYRKKRASDVNGSRMKKYREKNQTKINKKWATRARSQIGSPKSKQTIIVYLKLWLTIAKERERERETAERTEQLFSYCGELKISWVVFKTTLIRRVVRNDTKWEMIKTICLFTYLRSLLGF